MLKKFVTVVLVVVMLACIWQVEANDVRECFGVVTESSDGIVVADINMPNGEIHSWAFYADEFDYREGDPILAKIDICDDIILDVEHVEDAVK